MFPLKGPRRKQKATGTHPLTQRQAERVKVAASYLQTVEALLLRVFTRQASYRQAIKAKCIDCSGWQKREVALCTAETCPLWRYRPFQPKPIRQNLPSSPESTTE